MKCCFWNGLGRRGAERPVRLRRRGGRHTPAGDRASRRGKAVATAGAAQLLSYDCRQDATKGSTPAGSAANLPQSFRDTDRLMGVAVNADGLEDPAYAEAVADQFSQLAPENEMKWDAIEPAPGVFDFTRADAIVSFARATA